MSLRPHAPSTTLSAHRSLGGLSELLRERILALIEASGERGVIGDEVREALAGSSIKDGSINTRFSELERQGLICRNGDCRPGASGRQQLVLRAGRFAVESPVLKTKRTAFLEGMIYASKIVMKAEDLKVAKSQLKVALFKTATRKRG